MPGSFDEMDCYWCQKPVRAEWQWINSICHEVAEGLDPQTPKEFGPQEDVKDICAACWEAMPWEQKPRGAWLHYAEPRS